MLTDRQLTRYAEVLLWALHKARKAPFRRNDVILLRFDWPARPLAERLYQRLLRMAFQPVLRVTPTPNMEIDFYRWAGPRQLRFVAPGEQQLMQALNGSIYLYAPESITHLRRADPARIGKALRARKPLRDILDVRDEQGRFGWTLALMPTAELARQANITLQDFSAQVVKACFLNRADPLAHWETVYQNAGAIKQWLNQLPVRHLHIESASIDLVVAPGAQRRWIGLSGHNIPSFELFTSPDRRSTRGIYYADQPSFRSGNRVSGVRLEFRRGRVVAAQAAEGEAFLRQQLQIDPGAARLGEFSLTDKRFSKINAFMANTLYDENFGGRFGNCHIALGSSYTDTFAGEPRELTPAIKKSLGFNDSALHWDLVNTEPKRVTAHLAQGARCVIYENGCFSH